MKADAISSATTQSKQQRRELMPEVTKIVDDYLREFGLEEIHALEKANGMTVDWVRKGNANG